MQDTQGDYKAPTAARRGAPHSREALHVAMPMVAGLVLCMIIGLGFNKFFLAESSLKMLTVPALAYLYIYYSPSATLDFLRPPSARALGWCVAGFLFSMVASAGWMPLGLCVATGAGLFLRLDPRLTWRNLRQNPCFAGVILAGILSAPVLVMFRKYLWMGFSKLTATLMSWLLAPFYASLTVASRDWLLAPRSGLDTLVANLRDHGVRVTKHSNFFIITNGDSYMKFLPGMNLGNGVFLFLFLLALCAIARPDACNTRLLRKAYGWGLLFILLANVVWLSFLFLLLPGFAASDPNWLSIAARYITAPNTLSIISWLGYLLLDGMALAMLWAVFLRRR